MNVQFAAERIDTWVFKVGIAIPVVCIAALVLWHLIAYLVRKPGEQRRTIEPAPQPQLSAFSPKSLLGDQALAGSAPGESREDAAQNLATASIEDPRIERTRRAGFLLSLAKDDWDKQRFLNCLDRCKALAATFRDLPEAAEAKQLAAQIKSDPEKLQRACAALVGSLAEMYLELAESWSRKGEPERAAAVLQKLIQSCPETRQAQAARDSLLKLESAKGHS